MNIDHRIILKPITELKPADYNPREITEDALAGLQASLKRFGNVQPIVWNRRTGNVVSGHQRLKCLLAMGVESTRVVEVDLSEQDERALNVTQNNPHIAGDFTPDLQALLQDLQADLPEFDDLNLNDLLDDEPTEGNTDPDDVPDVPAEPVTRPGDIYTLGNHRLMCGDSTDPEQVETLMAGKKAEMIFTDPPYNCDYGSSKKPRHKIRKIENDSLSDNDWENFCKALYANFAVFCTGDIYMWGASGPDGMKMRLWLVETGCHWSATIVWKKQQLVLSPAKYQRMYEPCFYGWFDKSSFCGDRKQVEVWEFNRPLNSKLHPTMKPVELCENGIKNSSQRGSIILDFFLGSGSTLIACEQLGRKCYDMELDPKYCDVIVKRWEDFTGKKAKKVKN